MGTAENREIVGKISSGEVGLLDLWAEDGVWIIPGMATFRGKREIAEKLIGPKVVVGLGYMPDVGTQLIGIIGSSLLIVGLIGIVGIGVYSIRNRQK